MFCDTVLHTQLVRQSVTDSTLSQPGSSSVAEDIGPESHELIQASNSASERWREGEDGARKGGGVERRGGKRAVH